MKFPILYILISSTLILLSYFHPFYMSILLIILFIFFNINLIHKYRNPKDKKLNLQSESELSIYRKNYLFYSYKANINKIKFIFYSIILVTPIFISWLIYWNIFIAILFFLFNYFLILFIWLPKTMDSRFKLNNRIDMGKIELQDSLDLIDSFCIKYFTNNLYNKMDTIYYINSKYIGKIKKEHKHGFGVLYFENGFKYSGLWLNNMPNGIGTISTPEGNQFKGIWRDGEFRNYQILNSSDDVILSIDNQITDKLEFTFKNSPIDSKLKTILSIISICILIFVILVGGNYSLFQLLRIVITLISGYFIWIAYVTQNKFWIINFSLIALLFNPIVPIHFNRELWIIFDTITAIDFLISIFAFRLK